MSAQQNKLSGAGENESKKAEVLTFEKAKAIDDIETYTEFIKQHKNEKETIQAWTRLYELAYNEALKKDTSSGYKKFIDTYPNSKQKGNAAELFKKSQFIENTIAGNWNSFRLFIKKFPNNTWIFTAEDSIFSIGKRTQDLQALSYCADNFNGTKKENALLVFHDLYTNDGEKKTLDLFYAKYNDPILKEIRKKDYKAAELGDELMMENAYTANDFIKYDEYIRLAAPREKAFVALQRMISPYVSQKNWKAAIEKTKKYAHYFGNTNKKIIELISVLSAKRDKSIKINSVGNLINTVDGGEYMPVISNDDKLLYFCGRDREDNLGGEDIFVSKKTNDYWDTGHILSNLSSAETNDAPLSISTDGSTMLIFKSGKLYYTNKTISGWSNPIEFSENINSGDWQGDAMITSNGRGLLFSSTKAGGFNLYQRRQKYHGDKLYPSDIYISLMNDKDEWGEPINLGSTINTSYCDRMPFLHPDMKTLYFSSDGHGGLGKMDIYKSTRLADSCWNCWSEPVNLGLEINTNESDADYKITTTGDKAFFSYEKITYYENSALYLIDISGSMNGPKLESLIKAALSICKKAIQNNTEISILTFAGNCKSPIVNIFPFSKNADSLRPFFGNIKTIDGTPLYEAYLYACEYMKNNSNKKSKNRTITILTDGSATGCTTLNETLEKIKNNNEIYKTQTIAYDIAENSIAYSDLKRIAEFTKGNFHPTNNFEDLTSTFEGSINEIFNTNSTNYNKDIYWIDLPKYLRPDKVTTVSGKLVDKNNQPVSGRIRLEDLETGKIIGQSKSDPTDGSFIIVLPSGKIYGYYLDKDEYFPISDHVDLANNEKVTQIKKDISALKIDQLINDGMIISLNNIFFDFAESTLLPYSISELKRVAPIIKKSGVKVNILGHTDYIGNLEKNQILSEKRAESVKNFLISEGCQADRLFTKGYGETRPATSNKTAEGRAKNRRVEMSFFR